MCLCKAGVWPGGCSGVGAIFFRDSRSRFRPKKVRDSIRDLVPTLVDTVADVHQFVARDRPKNHLDTLKCRRRRFRDAHRARHAHRVEVAVYTQSGSFGEHAVRAPYLSKCMSLSTCRSRVSKFDKTASRRPRVRSCASVRCVTSSVCTNCHASPDS